MAGGGGSDRGGPSITERGRVGRRAVRGWVHTLWGYTVPVNADEEGRMYETSYTVTGMSCDHCVRAVTAEVGGLPGVTAVEVDLGSLRSAIEGRV